MLKDKLNIIQKEINRKKVNWNLITEILKSISNNINDEVEDYRETTSTLAYIIDFFEGNGESLVKIIELFLEYGFDPQQNNYNNGYSVLSNLPWTTGDHYMINAAKILLNAGAKSTKKLMKQ